ncbi:pre-RNA processing PIH1/Nop17-domain-containing protein [Daedaleopsis nitida]|nr:pre-RNA processing PIH1/Nop17-domain-containing protein [Daedaleopsis nitida]
MATTTVSLSPSPAFCLKSTALNSLSCSLSPGDAISIPTGIKVFVNVAWDTNVPPPPDGSDAAIERAMNPTNPVDSDEAPLWFVPVIVSDPRLDTDKAGKPSVVIDCVFNASLKSRSLRSPEFKTYLIELAFQRIEAQHSLLLSRQIGTPNILSKGKLQKRSVLIPTSLYSSAQPGGEPTAAPEPGPPRKPLIEELPAAPPKPKGILKKAPSTPESPSLAGNNKGALVPELTCSRTTDGRLRIALSVPHLTRASIPSTTLDIEPRRLIFTSPPSNPSSPGYALDLDLGRPDAELQNLFGSPRSATDALRLMRERELDVDDARAEWRIAEGTLVIYA